jgi:hypothetical protein
VQLSQSARALRQAGAGPEGKVRLLLPSTRSDLQRHIGDFKGKKFFVGLFKCYHDALHGVDPSSCSLFIVVVIKDAAVIHLIISIASALIWINRAGPHSSDRLLPVSEKDGALIPGIAMPADGNTAAHCT